MPTLRPNRRPHPALPRLGGYRNETERQQALRGPVKAESGLVECPCGTKFAPDPFPTPARCWKCRKKECAG